MTLSDTRSLILSKASQHEQRLAAAPKTLPAAARTRCSAPCSRTGCWPSAPRRGRMSASPGARTRTAPASRSALPTPACGPSEWSRTRAPRQARPRCPARAPRRRRTRFPHRGGRLPPTQAAQDAPARRTRPPVPRTSPGRTLRRCPRDARPTFARPRVRARPCDDNSDRGALAGPMERLRVLLACPPARRATPTRLVSRARAPSGRRCWRCCAAPRARPSRIAEATGWAATRPRLLCRAQAEAQRDRRAGARPPGRTEQGGRQGCYSTTASRTRRWRRTRRRARPADGGGHAGRHSRRPALAVALPRLHQRAGPRLRPGGQRAARGLRRRPGLGPGSQFSTWPAAATTAGPASARRSPAAASSPRCGRPRLDRITRRAPHSVQLLEDGYRSAADPSPAPTT